MSYFNQICNFSTHLHKSLKYQNFTKNRPTGGVYIWTVTTNLKDAFRDCANEPKYVAAAQYLHLPFRLIAISDKLVLCST